MSNTSPLATFVLLAYNQEQYVREAVEAALAQDYSPLEVIISDDCSTDRTLEIARNTVATYTGPHKVVVRKTARNCGSLLHVAEVAALARGELLVLAAADDISKPERTSVLVSAWQQSGSWALCSRYDRIDDSGQLLERDVLSPILKDHTFGRFFHETEAQVRVVHGCTSAYDRKTFDHLQLTSADYILSEDGALSVLLNLMGKEISHLDQSLVMYRESSGSLTNSRRARRPSYADIVEDEARIERFARSQANRCALFLRMHDYLGASRSRMLNIEEVRTELRRQSARYGWSDLSVERRLIFILKERCVRWALPRIFGLRIFLAAKWMFLRLFGRGEA